MRHTLLSNSHTNIFNSFNNFPGNQKDWVTIVKSDAPETSYKQWFYLNGGEEGQLKFNGLAPGHYEVRGYHKWPTGQYKVEARFSFSVVKK